MSQTTTQNAYLPLYILYYCWQQGDRTRYPLTLKGVCELRAQLDEYGLRQITNWQLSFQAPTESDFEMYEYDKVKLWYRAAYELPEKVRQTSIPRLTQIDMGTIEWDELPDDTLVFNTSRKGWEVLSRADGGWIQVCH